jgi:germination protein YpeB
MKKRNKILLASYVAALVLTLSGFAYRGYVEAAYYRRYIEAGWQRSFSDLAASVSEMDTALQKGLLSTSPALLGSACAEVYAKSLEAQQSLGELPFSDFVLEHTSGFIGKLGDYSRALAKASYTKRLGEEEAGNLKKLSEAAALLAQNLNQLRADMDGGLLTLGKLSAFSGSLESTALPTLGGSVASMETEFPEIPALIYDGPYSQSIKEGKPKFLEGLAEVDEKEAVRLASEFAGLPESAFSVAGKTGGNLPAYMLTASAGGGELALQLSAQGGKVVNMTNSRSPSYAKLDAGAAIKAAAAFLEERGYPSMKESYWTKNGSSLLINFAHSENGVLCYTDLIKVQVALDTGEVIGLEATGYIMSHTQRSLPQALVSSEEAAKRVSPQLKILSEGLAIIPTEGKNELFCREFKCEDAEGRHYIVYVNALTGAEEKILILIEDENGTLAT